MPFDETAIVVGREVTAEFAAKELNAIVKLATGREFKKVGGESRWTKDGSSLDCNSSTQTLKNSNTSTVHLQPTPTPQHRIFLGRSPECERLLGAAFFDGLGKEESAVFAKGNDLFLVGGDELGTLWAVYDFCEDNLGYRWYLDRVEGGETFVEVKSKSEKGKRQLKDIRCDTGGPRSVAAADGPEPVPPEVLQSPLKKGKGKSAGVRSSDGVTYLGRPSRRQPKFLGYRKVHNGVRSPWGSWLFRVRQRDNSALAMVLKGYRSEFQTQTPGHGFTFYLPPGKIGPDLTWCLPKGIRLEEDCFKKHPEWFSLMKDGKRSGDHQMCLSNPGARQALLAAIFQWMDAKGKGVYMVGENDARFGRYCHCPGCIALERKYNTTGGPMWDFILEACEAVKARYGEGYYVTSLAYDGLEQTEKAPANAVFPDNFIIDIAYIGTPDRCIHELPDRKAPEGEIVNYWQNTLNWRRITKHRSYWFYGTENPMMVYRRMQREIRELRDAGVESVGACGTGGGYEFSDLTRYLYYRLVYDPDCDIRRELEEACAFKYGKAAPDILAYIDGLEMTFVEFRRTCPNGPVFETNHPYRNMGFVSGRKIVEWRRILDRATERATEEGEGEEAKFHAQNVRFARIGLELLSVFYADRIAREVPDYAFDRAAAEARGLAIAKEYGEKYVPDNQVNEALEMLRQASDEMAYYGKLKSDVLPPELAAVYQPQFVTRILPYRREKMRSGKFTSEPDPKSACGYAIADEIGGRQSLAKGVNCYIWVWGAGRQLPLGTIPLSAFRKNRYVLHKVGTTTIPPDTSIIVADEWVTPLAMRYLNRCHIPSAPNRRFDIWFSVRAEGPAFFPGDTGPNRILIDQIFAIELVGNGE